MEEMVTCWSFSSRWPRVVGRPWTSKLSLTVVGTPNSGADLSGCAVEGAGAGPGAVEVPDDYGVNAGIEPLGAGDVVVQEFQGTDLSAADKGGELGGGEKGRVHGLILRWGPGSLAFGAVGDNRGARPLWGRHRMGVLWSAPGEARFLAIIVNGCAQLI